MNDRLFSLDDIPEIPLLRPPRESRGAQIEDERLGHDYPPEWNRCVYCVGTGRWAAAARTLPCPTCLGMGSVKARVRLEAGHRCVRCGHPYIPKGDAKALGVEPSPFRWSPCDRTTCTHFGPRRSMILGEETLWRYEEETGLLPRPQFWHPDAVVEAEWRILTVHHLDGDKANLAWWNLAALCQRCHLEIQARVVIERIYPHEHSEWFRPYAAGYYARVYLGEDLSRDDTMARLDELLALERAA